MTPLYYNCTNDIHCCEIGTMPELSVKEWEERIRKKVGQNFCRPKDEDAIKDLAKSATYLNRDIVKKHLNILDKKLLDRLRIKEKELKISLWNGSSLTKKPGKDYASNYKIFTDFFKDWLKENGFNTGGEYFCLVELPNGKKERQLIEFPAEMPLLLGTLKDHAFIEVLLWLGNHAKDLDVYVDHFEFTHLLQFYILTEEAKLRKELKYTPAELYKKMAEFPFSNYSKGIKEENHFIWDRLFDHVQEREFGFHEAESLIDEVDTGFLSSLLNEILKGRAQKRIGEKVDDQVDFQETVGGAKPDTEKYKNLPGLWVNENILFRNYPTNEQVKVTLDEVAPVCLYDPVIATKFSTPVINVNAPLIDQLIQLFSTKEFNSDKSLAEQFQNFSLHANPEALKSEILKKLHELKQSINAGEALSHRELSLYFYDLTIKKFGVQSHVISPLEFLINEAQGILLNHDVKLKLLTKLKQTTQKLTEDKFSVSKTTPFNKFKEILEKAYSEYPQNYCWIYTKLEGQREVYYAAIVKNKDLNQKTADIEELPLNIIVGGNSSAKDALERAKGYSKIKNLVDLSSVLVTPTPVSATKDATTSVKPTNS